MIAIDLAKAVLLREAEESQTIFGSADDMLETLVLAIATPLRKIGSSFDQLRVLATKNGFILKHRSQLNSAALRRFIEFGEPEMALLAAEVMHECGVRTRLDIGELEFASENQTKSDRIYAFSERKLMVRAVGDDDFCFVLRWHREAYWQEWYKDVGVTPGFHWNAHIDYESYVHWPRIELTNTGKLVLRTLKVHDPPLELPERPPTQIRCTDRSTSSSS